MWFIGFDFFECFFVFDMDDLDQFEIWVFCVECLQLSWVDMVYDLELFYVGFFGCSFQGVSCCFIGQQLGFDSVW